MAEVVLLSMADLRVAHQVLLERFADDPEPMPTWQEGNPALLETCVHCTEVSAFGEAKYSELIPKAAKLFYSGIKLHIFPNGNKRFGVVVLLFFLIKNGQRLDAQRGELAYMATWVAATDPHRAGSTPDDVIAALVDFLEARLHPDPPPA